MRACRVNDDALRSVELYASHEALIWSTNAPSPGQRRHRLRPVRALVWVGERTGRWMARISTFVSRIANPIGVKLGPTTSPSLPPRWCSGSTPTVCRATHPDHPMGNERVRDACRGSWRR